MAVGVNTKYKYRSEQVNVNSFTGKREAVSLTSDSLRSLNVTRSRKAETTPFDTRARATVVCAEREREGERERCGCAAVQR